MELSSSRIKKIIYILGNWIFWLFIFWEMDLFYILGNTNLKIIPYISGSNFPSLKSRKNPLMECFLHYGKWNFLAPSLKNSFFWRNFQSHKNQNLYFSKKKQQQQLLNKFFQKHFLIMDSIFSINWIKQYYWHTKILKAFLCVESFFSF